MIEGAQKISFENQFHFSIDQLNKDAIKNNATTVNAHIPTAWDGLILLMIIYFFLNITFQSLIHFCSNANKMYPISDFFIYFLEKSCF